MYLPFGPVIRIGVVHVRDRIQLDGAMSVLRREVPCLFVKAILILHIV